MNLPKKLKLEQGSKIWIWANDKLAVSIMSHFANDVSMAKEVCKRYNNYPTLLLALIGTSIGLCLTIIALLCMS